MPTRHMKRTTQVTLTIFDDLYSKWAISFFLGTVNLRLHLQSIKLYFLLCTLRRLSELSSQNVETAVSLSPLQRPQVPSSSEWSVSAPPPAPQTGQLRGNCRKLPHFLVPPERERSSARRAKEMRRKASRRADPGTVKSPKVGARRSATPGLSCPGCAGPAASPARQIDT